MSVLGNAIPLRVPWSVSPSTGYFGLTMFPASEGDPATVHLEASFIPEVLTRLRNAVPVTPFRFEPAQPVDANQRPERWRIEVCFQSAYVGQMICGEFDVGDFAETLRWYSVLGNRLLSFEERQYGHDGHDVYEIHEAKTSHWRRTGWTTDPWCYQILDSVWLADMIRRCQLKDTMSWRHYLFTSNDAWIEVAALGCSWRLEGQTREFPIDADWPGLAKG